MGWTEALILGRFGSGLPEQDAPSQEREFTNQNWNPFPPMKMTRQGGVRMCSRLITVSVSLVLMSSTVFAAPPPPPDADEAFLRKQGLPTDSAGLIRFLQERTGEAATPERIRQLVRQLGDENFQRREEASQRLRLIGQPATGELRRHLKDPDLELRRRARQCLDRIGPEPPVDCLWHAVRLLGKRRAARATETLLAFLPSAREEEVEEAVYLALNRVAFTRGKAESALEAALTDREPARRAAAGCLLGAKGGTTLRGAVRKLLRDAKPIVQLRAAQGLLASGDSSGLPALVGLLAEAPREIAWQAEELLRYVAGEDSPQEVIGQGKVEARRRCQAAWQRWLGEKGRTVKMEAVQRSGRCPGLVLTFEGPPENADDQEPGKARKEARRLPRVWLCGWEGQPRCEAMRFVEFAATRLPLASHRQLACNSQSPAVVPLMMSHMWPRVLGTTWVETEDKVDGYPNVHLVVALANGDRLLDVEARGRGPLHRVVQRDSQGWTVWESTYRDPVAAILICPLLRFGFVRQGTVLDLDSETGRLGQLRHRDSRVREFASWRLRQLPRTDKVIKAIADRLDEEEEVVVRNNLLRTLEGLGLRAEPAIPAVARQLGEGLSEAPHLAAGILVNCGMKGREALLKAYRDRTGKYAIVRQETTACWLAKLAGERDPRIHAVISDALQSEHARVRSHACGGLGVAGKGGRRHVMELVRLLRDKEEYVAIAAVEALGRIGDKAALPALMKLATRDTDPLYLVALRSVGKISSNDVRAARRFADMLAKEKKPGNRSCIIEAMQYHRSEEGVVILVPILLAVRNNERGEGAKVTDFAQGALDRMATVLAKRMLAGKKWQGEVKETYMIMWEIRPNVAEEAFERWVKKAGVKSSDIKDRPTLPRNPPPQAVPLPITPPAPVGGAAKQE